MRSSQGAIQKHPIYHTAMKLISFVILFHIPKLFRTCFVAYNCFAKATHNLNWFHTRFNTKYICGRRTQIIQKILGSNCIRRPLCEVANV